MSDRQVGLWDTSSFKNLDMMSLDSSAYADPLRAGALLMNRRGVLMPFFAEGNDVLFLAGKG